MNAGAKKNDRRPTGAAVKVRASSGSVFRDLQVPGNAEALAKAEIAVRIAFAIQRRGLTQARAAAMFGVDQADVSDLVRGKLKGFSTDRLLRFLIALGQDVRIVIVGRRHSRRIGRLSVLDDVPRSA